MKKTIFTKILEGSVQAHILAKSEHTFSMLDASPLTKGHSLIITKRQVDHLDDCTKEEYSDVFAQVHELSKQLKKAFSPKRIAIVVHGFEVPHAHVHVVPLYTGKEMSLAAKDRDKPSKSELEKVKRELHRHNKTLRDPA